MILNAKGEYFKRLGRKLFDPNEGIKSCWFTLNRVINKNKALNIPLLLENGLFITIFIQSCYIKCLFVEQCCAIPTESALQNLRPRSDTILENVEIDKEKVVKLIRALDPSKTHGCDNISIAMIKTCDFTIVDPLCVIFEKCLETCQ